MRGAAVVLAAGRGDRIGGDKALLDLGGVTLLEQVLADCRAAGIDEIIVVRSADSVAITSHECQIVTVEGGGPMLESYRCGFSAVSVDCGFVIAWPVDYALAGAGTVALLTVALRSGAEIAIPICNGRPGHPIGLSRSVAQELLDPSVKTLRDVVRRDPARVTPVMVANRWVLRDLDTQADLAAARVAHATGGGGVLEVMRAHRSRRSFRPDPIGDPQIQRLVDAARHASTSSFIQAYSVVAVRDPERKVQVAHLCADQPHIHEAPVFLAICADLHKLHLSCESQGMNLQAGSLELFLQACVDAALVGQNLQLAAESEGLGACMIGAARNHPVDLAQVLGLPPRCFVLFGMVLGLPADDPLPRGRMPLDGVLFFERYSTEALDGALDAADAAMREWAAISNRSRGGYGGQPINETRGWRQRMAWLWGRTRNERDALLSQLRTLGFPLDLRQP